MILNDILKIPTDGRERVQSPHPSPDALILPLVALRWSAVRVLQQRGIHRQTPVCTSISPHLVLPEMPKTTAAAAVAVGHAGFNCPFWSKGGHFRRLVTAKLRILPRTYHPPSSSSSFSSSTVSAISLLGVFRCSSPITSYGGWVSIARPRRAGMAILQIQVGSFVPRDRDRECDRDCH